MATQGIMQEVSDNIEHSVCPGPSRLASSSSSKYLQRKPNSIRSSSGVRVRLNARSRSIHNIKNGKVECHINQYIIKEEIGRGSFGAVHRSIDQNGNEYAIKEFSKSKLRKKAQLNILKCPPLQRKKTYPKISGTGIKFPFHWGSSHENHKVEEHQLSSLHFIEEEIEIMKRLNHPNVVRLIEVLDDPNEDSLYMVLELCHKGVVMKIGLEEKAPPFPIETCRLWFRHLILGLEYIHAQGILHRDIKPDNLLLTNDNVLKIVDFGASEMFEKNSDMMTEKSVGSPAFLPPELCVTNHGKVLGTAIDIWALGVSLYCFKFGHLPFERASILELFEAIKHDDPNLGSTDEYDFNNLMGRILGKDPYKRIKIEELRTHPWVTKNGTDPLLSKEENTANIDSVTLPLNESTLSMNNRMISVSYGM